MTAILTKDTAAKTIGGSSIIPVRDRSRSLNVLFYGDSGTGKTRLAGSADAVPDMRPVLIVDVEGGTESLRKPYPRVDTVRVKTWKEMQKVYDDLHMGSHDYQTIVVDSLTEVQKFNMDQIMVDTVEKRSDQDPDVPSMREWGKNLTQMRRYTRAFRDLPISTIFTALALEKKDDATGRVSIKPSLSGKLADEVAAFLDIVCYYYTKQIPAQTGEEPELARILLTRKTDKHIAKDRTDRLPMILRDPDMKMIYDLIYPKEK